MPKTKTHILITALLVSLTVLANIAVFNISLGNAYYAVMIAALSVLILSRKRPKINLAMLAFILICICSIFVNDIPYFYKPYERLFAFTIMVALIGPLIKNASLIIFKQLLFKYLNKFIVLMVSISFLGLVVNSSLVYMGRGGFTGLFNHSMVLSPMAAISMITCSYYGASASNNTKKVIFYFLAFFSFIACLTAGSRAALIAGILGVLYFFYKGNQQNLKKYFRVIIISLFVGAITFPLWETYTEKLIQKMEYSDEQGGLLATRESIWERRLDEFVSSPIFGIGYANDTSKSENDLFIGEGQIEPGSTWLVILSMTGLLGVLLFINMFIKIIKKNQGRNKNGFVFYQNALLIFFIAHLIAEGYGLSAGSGLFFYFWLLLGVMDLTKPFKSTKKQFVS